jgi:hypothetical protein
MRRSHRCVGGSSLFCATTSVVVARIYREDLPRVIASRNGLVLSLLKRIRHGLVSKLNSKRRSRICEALDWILADYSCVLCAPAPIASPHHATSRPVRPSERAHARVFLHFSSPLHTYKCIESNPLYK